MRAARFFFASSMAISTNRPRKATSHALAAPLGTTSTATQGENCAANRAIATTASPSGRNFARGARKRSIGMEIPFRGSDDAGVSEPSISLHHGKII